MSLTPEDLQTTREEYAAGFRDLVLTKSERLTPYVRRGELLLAQLQQVAAPEELMTMPALRPHLLAAAGFSEKAAKNVRLSEEQQAALLQEFIEKTLLPAGSRFREEVVYRYLLMQGDAFGGSMRNLIGARAKRRLAEYVMAAADLAGHRVAVQLAGRKNFLPYDPQAMTAHEVRALAWTAPDGSPRLLAYDRKAPVVGQRGNNLDVLLLRSTPAALAAALHDPERYLACGELKGGIDPAGADEHWKTARAALDRVAERLPQVPTFFMGAAIEPSMAAELAARLAAGTLSRTANLGRPQQVATLANWLVQL